MKPTLKMIVTSVAATSFSAQNHSVETFDRPHHTNKPTTQIELIELDNNEKISSFTKQTETLLRNEIGEVRNISDPSEISKAIDSHTIERVDRALREATLFAAAILSTEDDKSIKLRCNFFNLSVKLDGLKHYLISLLKKAEANHQSHEYTLEKHSFDHQYDRTVKALKKCIEKEKSGDK